MTRLSLSDMGVDLTNELASLLQLSVSDKWFIGKSFIDEFTKALILSDIKKLKSLSDAYHNIDYPQPDSWLLAYEKNVLSVFDAIKKKLYPICSLSVLIEWFEIEHDHHGWGDIFVEGFRSLKKNGIEYINPDFQPYKYADEGMPYIEHWCTQELLKNDCPFISENSIDYVFEMIDKIREIQNHSVDSDLYCFISHNKGLRMIDRKNDAFIR